MKYPNGLSEQIGRQMVEKVLLPAISEQNSTSPVFDEIKTVNQIIVSVLAANGLDKSTREKAVVPLLDRLLSFTQEKREDLPETIKTILKAIESIRDEIKKVESKPVGRPRKAPKVFKRKEKEVLRDKVDEAFVSNATNIIQEILSKHGEYTPGEIKALPAEVKLKLCFLPFANTDGVTNEIVLDDKGYRNAAATALSEVLGVSMEQARAFYSQAAVGFRSKPNSCFQKFQAMQAEKRMVAEHGDQLEREALR